MKTNNRSIKNQQLLPGVRAFTLIELLVVMAIIGLLVTLTVPVIGSAMRSAYKAKCQAQLQQIGYAINFYVNHNPRNERQLYPVKDQWPKVIGTYLKDTNTASKVFQCPVAGRPTLDSCYSAHPTVFGTSSNTCFTLSKIRRPVDTLLVADGTQASSGNASDDLTALASYVSRSTLTRETPLPDSAYAKNDKGAVGTLVLRHLADRQDAVNILFVDNHVQAAAFRTVLEKNVAVDNY